MPTFNKDVSTIRIAVPKQACLTQNKHTKEGGSETDYAVLIGLDWSSLKHDLCVLDTKTKETTRLVLTHTPEQINEWVSELIAKYPGQRIAICLEQSRGPLVYALMDCAEIDLYSVNPASFAKYRNAFQPSGAKNDVGDAALLLDMLLRHREQLKVWRPHTPAMRLLSSLCRDRRKIVDSRTKRTNALCAKLKEYYPQAIELVGDILYSELCCAFLKKWPSWDRLAAAKPDQIRKFYYAQRCRNPKVIENRLELIATGCALTNDAAVIESNSMFIKALIDEIRVLNKSIAEYDARISKVFKEHPDTFIFKSFPGAGQQQAPRLMVAFGEDRDRYESAEDVASLFGVAPVLTSSGKQMSVRWRYHAPKFLRQSIVEYAGSSIIFSKWAKLYYNEQRKRGKGHNAAVRALAFKWIRILFKCWKDRVPYDEQKYLASLKQHGSWLAEAVNNAA